MGMGVQDEPDNGGHENGQEMPGFRFDSGWKGGEPNDNPNDDNDETSFDRPAHITFLPVHKPLLSGRFAFSA
jgi:hypothetical protein